MASALMATQSSRVAGLGSALLRSKDVRVLRGSLKVERNFSRQVGAPIRAAKPPQGVSVPSDEPSIPKPLWGFTENAEVWNSRAALLGLVGIVIVEAIINKGLLEAIGVDVGKGLNLPL